MPATHNPVAARLFALADKIADFHALPDVEVHRTVHRRACRPASSDHDARHAAGQLLTSRTQLLDNAAIAQNLRELGHLIDDNAAFARDVAHFDAKESASIIAPGIHKLTAAGLRRVDIAGAVGISQPQVTKYQSGTTTPRAANIPSVVTGLLTLRLEGIRDRALRTENDPLSIEDFTGLDEPTTIEDPDGDSWLDEIAQLILEAYLQEPALQTLRDETAARISDALAGNIHTENHLHLLARLAETPGLLGAIEELLDQAAVIDMLAGRKGVLG